MNDSSSEYGPKQVRLIKRLKSPLVFRLFTRKMVPAAAYAGVRFVSLDSRSCEIRVPNKRRNRNPFRSMYFAVQSMGAEMSTALLAMFHMEDLDTSIAWIVIDIEAHFPAKAVDNVTFRCSDGMKVSKAIKDCIATGEAQTVRLLTQGYMPDGTLVSEFVFHWSFKKRSGSRR